MFRRLLAPRSPVSPQTQVWVATVFRLLRDRFGDEQLNGAVALPTTDHFPEQFDGNVEPLESVLQKVKARLGIESEQLLLIVYDTDEHQRQLLHAAGTDASWASGDVPPDDLDLEDLEDCWPIRVSQDAARDPVLAVASVTREACRMLLTSREVFTDEDDGTEQAIDLATIFFGYGIFAANSLVRESHWSAAAASGWSLRAHGCLTFPILGYALALYARLRFEHRPTWSRHLRPDARSQYRRAARYLGQPRPS